MTDPYTPKSMDAARTSDELRAGRDARIDGLRAEASAAVASTANTLRAVGQRYREAYADELARWQALRDELDTVERGRPDPGSRLRALPDPGAEIDDPAAAAAESRADAARVRELRADVEALGLELGHQQTELAKMEIALRNLESTWLFLERGDSSLVREASEGLPTDVQMRIVEAQESERSRLAQEVHDGPAQVLTNAIFQVEYLDRVLDDSPETARAELAFLRTMLREGLEDVRSFIANLRPPSVEVGLKQAITDAAAEFAAKHGIAVEVSVPGIDARVPADAKAPILRVVQEALQNVRKHAAATAVRIGLEDDHLVIVDNGRGFDVMRLASATRNFGLQFMRDRAELMGSSLQIESRQGEGTRILLRIPEVR